jgi:hypothetical protein
MVRDARKGALLTMRANFGALLTMRRDLVRGRHKEETLILRSRAQRGVSKDGREHH